MQRNDIKSKIYTEVIVQRAEYKSLFVVGLGALTLNCFLLSQ